MIMRILVYLFPKRHLREKLPLLPRQFSSNHFPGAIPEHVHEEISFIRLAGLARTDADAYRLLKGYHKQGIGRIDQIIKLASRERRQMSTWARAKRRFRAMF